MPFSMFILVVFLLEFLTISHVFNKNLREFNIPFHFVTKLRPVYSKQTRDRIDQS